MFVTRLMVGLGFYQATTGGYMVAFAGQKYAARSLPIMFADNSHTIISFTLVSFDMAYLFFCRNKIFFRYVILN